MSKPQILPRKLSITVALHRRSQARSWGGVTQNIRVTNLLIIKVTDLLTKLPSSKVEVCGLLECYIT
jgi:hypothetical protein